MSLNKVMLIGNVGKDPEVRYIDNRANQSANATKVAQFSVATTERYKDRNGEQRETTDWHNIVAWRALADVAEKYVKKGTKVFIEGKLRTREYQDQSGQRRFVTEVVAERLETLGQRRDDGAERRQQSPADPGPVYRPQPRQQQSDAFSQPEDDLPF